ncbi:hypothetical protein GCM10007170_23850 [Arthrobacter liuii]|uniref:Uncharacterized protein n=1 Tax=Arthrobacter liuii TaxID=1476996 RepID=A0ABQ2AUU8_9MICC|nr:hypothetical protein GCM10007170_23850 [Arthrobacter liuii]
MHPPEPVYPCYLPVLGEFNRMTPHEGPSDTLPEHAARLESGFRAVAARFAEALRIAMGTHGRDIPLLIPVPPAIMGTCTDWGNLKVVSCVAWLNGTDPAAQRCSREWARWGRPFSGCRDS